eukprot:gene4119-5872_t
MGVESSTELPKHFHDITKWPKARVESVIKAYQDGEYDFGIDYSVIMNVTGYDVEEAKELCQAHSKNDTGIINAITLFVSIISLGNGDSRNELGRLESLFDLMDFSRNGQISLDEMTILLLCVGYSFSFILSYKSDSPIDPIIIKFAKGIYESLNKKPSASITKTEFIDWIKNKVFSKGLININSILNGMIHGVEVVGDGAEEDNDVK